MDESRENDKNEGLEITLEPYEGRGVTVEKYHPDRVKEEGAFWVAKGIVFAFAGSLFLVLATTIVVYIVSSNFERPADSLHVVSSYRNTFVDLLEALGTFSSTVFGPLLAFILGYYFAKGAKKPER